MVLRTNYLRRFGIVLAGLLVGYFLVTGIISTFFSEDETCKHKFMEEYAIIDRYAYTALSSIINAEADTEDPMDMYLIGSTVLNRVEHEFFPTCVIDVVFQKRQYNGIAGNFNRTAVTDTIASRLLNGQGRNKDVLFFYNYHTATDSRFIKFLETNCELITVTKNHKFYGVCEVN